MRRFGLAIPLVLIGTALTACGQTPQATIVDHCVIGPNNSCVAAQLEGTDFHGTVVKGSDFTKANLRNADLRGSDFAGANLFVADLTGARVDGGNFAAANMIGTICPSGKVATGTPAACPDLPVRNA